jgi:uncharacterized protein (TIGR03083 family)
VILKPRYDGPVLFEIEGAPDDVLAPLVRQRRRLEATLGKLDGDQWQVQSRCEHWRVHDVVAHLVTVNTFWQVSVEAGLGGTPTRMLAAFDPQATPPQLIADLATLPPAELLGRFTASNDGFLALVTDLDDPGWGATAESPPGHVSVRLACYHALWDSWIHERDVTLPLGLTPAVEADEVAACLRYAAVLGPAFWINEGTAEAGTFAVDAHDPDIDFVLEVGDRAAVRAGAAPTGADVLQGDAVDLAEALSLRLPLPASAPGSWAKLLGGLATVFDTEVGPAATP